MRDCCLFLFVVLALCSCETVRPYQRVYLNDPGMELSRPAAAGYEASFEAYREGAAGANGGKASGGCGCN
ncbi:MAG: DUF4266 domain-containing protein [Phaeodactylibacter sp.]|nr:DUF4266 domain-containing protein [Phaeodactylibacter sp.]MCB9276789.1 DUF4266 domain-containing protein [Lewinellaceae bacterium]